MKLVRYHGDLVDVPTVAGMKNVQRCYNPLCDRHVETRPAQSSMAGAPKRYCSEKCRYQWKQRLNKERKLREEARIEEMN